MIPQNSHLLSAECSINNTDSADYHDISLCIIQPVTKKIVDGQHLINKSDTILF